MKKKYVFFYVFLLCFQYSFSKNINQTTLNVRLVDKDFLANEAPVIKIKISSYPFGGLEFFASKDSSYEQEALKNGNVFMISAPSDVFYMNISYSGKMKGVYYWMDNIYTINAGSNLTIELGKQNIKFSGEGAMFSDIQSQIIGKKLKVLPESLLNLFNTKEYGRYFAQFDKSLDSVLKLQLDVIESNRLVLSDGDMKLLIANCYGFRYFTQLRDYDFQSEQNELFAKALKKYYSNKSNTPKSDVFANEIIEKSPIFANYLLEEMDVLEKLNQEKYLRKLSKSQFLNVLKKINKDYSGIFRDKLLALFVMRTENNKDAIPFFNEICNTVKSKKYSELLLNRIKMKQNNLPFLNFELQDKNGKMYALEDFKNKVVVLDFWFTGCENCGILNQAMKPIVKHFRNYDRIKFVNVSIDKNKNQWLHSIQSGDYTHPESVNLFTNGVGANHDLIRYYQIIGYPTVFIIKDGLMFSSLPPRPSLNIPSGQDISLEGTKLIELLEQALK